MSRKRLSKKQLKSDRFVQRTFDWAHWAETHRNQVIAGVVGIVVLGGAFFVYRAMAQSAEEEAARNYGEARQAYFAGNYQLAASDLEGFIRRHGDSRYGDDAQFFLADALYEAGDAAGAVKGLQEFLDRHEDSPFAASARTLLGAAYLKLGQYPQAVAAYEAALEEASHDAERIQIRQALADVYQAQEQNDQAVAQYRAILELAPESPAATDARREIAELTVKPLGAPTGAPQAAVGNP
jgi:predicted negative regulator of RcsB-dependent stress response